MPYSRLPSPSDSGPRKGLQRGSSGTTATVNQQNPSLSHLHRKASRMNPEDLNTVRKLAHAVIRLIPHLIRAVRFINTTLTPRNRGVPWPPDAGGTLHRVRRPCPGRNCHAVQAIYPSRTPSLHSAAGRQDHLELFRAYSTESATGYAAATARTTACPTPPPLHRCLSPSQRALAGGCLPMPRSFLGRPGRGSARSSVTGQAGSAGSPEPRTSFGPRGRPFLP